MNSKVLSYIKSNNMINSGDRIIVGLSGGADSVCLLHFLNSIKDEFELELHAAHLNHMLRGQEAERDSLFCARLCSELDIPFHIKYEDIAAMSKQSSKSVEECGRDARYAFFDSLAKEYSCSKTATAHTLSDNAETLLLNLTRGVGLKGLCGIPPVRGSIIRPLLCCTRSEIEDYCKKHQLEYMTDSTNLSDDYSRNYIRHNIVAGLKSRNPSFEQSVFRTTSILSDDEDYLDGISRKVYSSAVSPDGTGLSCDVLKNEHKAIRTRVICRFFKNNGIEIDNRTVNQADYIIEKVSGKINLSCGRALAVKKGFAVITRQKTDNSVNTKHFAEIDPELSDNTEHRFVISSSKELILRKINKNSADYLKNINKNLFNNFINYDMISGNIIIRTRMEGDHIRLAKRGCTKSLHKLFNEAAIPLQQRDNIIILQDDIGIIWVEGFGADARTAINQSTENVLIINIGENRENDE